MCPLSSAMIQHWLSKIAYFKTLGQGGDIMAITNHMLLFRIAVHQEPWAVTLSSVNCSRDILNGSPLFWLMPHPGKASQTKHYIQ